MFGVSWFADLFADKPKPKSISIGTTVWQEYAKICNLECIKPNNDIKKYIFSRIRDYYNGQEILPKQTLNKLARGKTNGKKQDINRK